ncbi:MAG: hypothetical protein ACYDCL_10725 [Myxococcales bacterium]
MTRTLEPELGRAREALAALAAPAQRLKLGGRAQTVAAWLRELDAALARKSAVRTALFALATLRAQDLRARRGESALLANLHAVLRASFGNDHPLLDAKRIPRTAGRPRGSRLPRLRQAAATAQAVATKRRRYPPKAVRQALRAPPVTIEVRAADGTLLARHGPPRR